ncbi:MAG: hypothetical protein GTO45_16575 [Candidatus Aminicenantes bacterium]|nr:hypothetical protein [Candidatus Aminicenantes bacterium]NIM80356.1 hypothetical protein [Candidatus Aminicenantes bacterium]NIN19743.1 hypothetical protein [Candidatus Aminicenantes bacterium]NIN43625.1 hypothetical protein [Candidatus Aminicenantes bacterium]NIN86370.1 hypothetical protein [Candidatus Aminicenantes bacterium]
MLSKPQFAFRVIIFLFICLMLTPKVFPYIFGNGSGGGYGNGEGSEEIIGNSNSTQIETLVIKGAVYFLDANSNIMAFLNRVEKSEIEKMDFQEAQKILECAARNMHLAASTYTELIRLAEQTPYNEKVIERLMVFDYPGFMAKHELNSIIFNETEGYLITGDITGVYKNISARFKTILDKITYIRGEINTGKFPPISQCWELSETCYQTLIFGQYLSMVFYNLKN